MSAYHRPQTLREALGLLGTTPQAVVLAGGTDVYPARASQSAWGKPDHRPVIDISGLAELRGIEDRGDHWWIGALTTWTEVTQAELPPLFDGLRAASRDVGGAQVQNSGTIAGNCVTASPAGDGIPCLLTLGAEIEVAGSPPTTCSAETFFTGYRKTALAPGEIVTGIRIPKQSGRGAFSKLGARRFLVISIAMVAAVVECDPFGVVTAARFAVGACGPAASRLSALEAALIGHKLDPARVRPEHFAHLAPIDDVRASAAYRRHAAMILTQDLIASLSSAMALEAAHG